MQGYAVTVAPGPAEGAHLALSSPPTAVVADLWMPGISGVQLCRLLRAEPATENVPVVLRGPDGQRNRFWAERAGAAAYVVKGHMGDLVRTLSRAVTSSPATRRLLHRPRPCRHRHPRSHRVLSRQRALRVGDRVRGAQPQPVRRVRSTVRSAEPVRLPGGELPLDGGGHRDAGAPGPAHASVARRRGARGSDPRAEAESRHPHDHRRGRRRLRRHGAGASRWCCR